MRGQRWIRGVVVFATVVASVGLASGRPVAAQDAPPTPTPCERVGVIGDSLTVGATRHLAQELVEVGVANVRIDAQISRRITFDRRQVRSGLTALREMRSTGFEPDCFVVALGTNDLGSWKAPRKFRAGLEAVLTEIGDGPRVLWVNVAWTRFLETGGVFNGLLGEFSASRPNLAIADWAGALAGHADWLTRDGVHQSIAGRRAWARLVVHQLTNGAPAAPPAPECSVSAVPLKVGARSTDATCLESRLHQLRYQSRVPDGRFSYDTRIALANWQSVHGLAGTGILDAGTRTALGLDPSS